MDSINLVLYHSFMMQVYFWLMLHFTSIIIRSEFDIPSFECKLLDTNWHLMYLCVVQSMFILNESHPHFRLNSVPQKPLTAIREIQFNSCCEIQKMHTFTSDICDNFPDLKSITAYGLELVLIQENAFENCQKLQHIDFSSNNLTYLSPDTFKMNSDLKQVTFTENKFETVNFKVFDTIPDLRCIEFGSNQLRRITNLDLMNEMKTVLRVHLNDNDFEDLENLVKSLIEKFPSMQILKLACETQMTEILRLKEIYDSIMIVT